MNVRSEMFKKILSGKIKVKHVYENYHSTMDIEVDLMKYVTLCIITGRNGRPKIALR
jgi:hypothetical protein